MSSTTTGLFTLDRPADWEQLENPDADLVFAAPISVTDGGVLFRPNVVVTSVESSVSIEEASSVVIATEYALHPGARMIAVEPWLVQLQVGRYIQFSYPAGDAQVVVERWVWVTDHHQVHLSASCAPYQLAAYEPVFSAIASSVAFTAEA